MGIVIGLDVHSKQTVYHAQDEEGSTVATGSVETSVDGLQAMLLRCRALEGTRVGLETGTQARFVTGVLEACAMTPVVIDAREVRQKARRARQKTDERDAFEICDGLRRGVYTNIVWMPPERICRLREALSRRRHFVSTCTRQVSAAKFVLRSEGIKTAGIYLTSATAWEKLLGRPEAQGLRDFLWMHYEVWRVARALVEQLDGRIEELLVPYQEVRELLESVPGVGPVIAATFIAAIGDVGRFPTSHRVSSYVGLAPSTYDSGERERHGGITKAGSSALRAVLCEGAHQARRNNHPLNPYYRKMVVRCGKKRAVTAVANRLVRILFQIWRKKEAFDVKYLNVEFRAAEVRKTACFRLKSA